jgi:hypothetical protein
MATSVDDSSNVVAMDVNGDGSVETSGFSSNDSNNMNDGKDSIETDDPWDVISKFIQTNILFGSPSTNNNDVATTATTINENGDISRSTSTSSDTSRNGILSPKENIWNSFRSSTNDAVEQEGDSNLPVDKQQQQEKQLNDVIQEGWNQFIQNLVALPNPFIYRSGDEDNEDASKSQHHPHLHTDADSSHHRYDALTELIESVSSTGHHQNSNTNQLSIPNMIDLFWKTLQNVRQQLEGTFKSVLDLIMPIVNPLQLYYFMLEQEILHNPVYKRRQHAYFTEVSVDTAIQISEGLYVSQLA